MRPARLPRRPHGTTDRTAEWKEKARAGRCSDPRRRPVVPPCVTPCIAAAAAPGCRRRASPALRTGRRGAAAVAARAGPGDAASGVAGHAPAACRRASRSEEGFFRAPARRTLGAWTRPRDMWQAKAGAARRPRPAPQSGRPRRSGPTRTPDAAAATRSRGTTRCRPITPSCRPKAARPAAAAGRPVPGRRRAGDGAAPHRPCSPPAFSPRCRACRRWPPTRGVAARWRGTSSAARPARR